MRRGTSQSTGFRDRQGQKKEIGTIERVYRAQTSHLAGKLSLALIEYAGRKDRRGKNREKKFLGHPF